jgi:DNA recombination-dependent growth factor C
LLGSRDFRSTSRVASEVEGFKISNEIRIPSAIKKKSENVIQCMRASLEGLGVTPLPLTYGNSHEARFWPRWCQQQAITNFVVFALTIFIQNKIQLAIKKWELSTEQ